VRTVLAPSRLIVVATGAAVALPAAAQAIIGRSDPVSQFIPDVDLTPYGALDNGVGRRQARLFLQNGQFMLEDLDSTNGTFVNGRKLNPGQPVPLGNGDQVQFGRLGMQFLL
jgi:pSer/pThr/pTyr-binding forkhead associated (FHA) protein